jgi:Capsule polysaccharide biosynthesis protein
MRSDTGFAVLLEAQSEYRGLLTEVARRLKERNGARVHLYCATTQEEEFYRTRYGAHFETIAVDRSLYSGCREPVADADVEIAQARRNEAAFGLSYNRLAMTDRHLGRGYALGGFKHPRSYLSRDTSYLQMVQGFNRAIAFWRNEIAEKNPVAVINCGKIAALIARAEGIPFRTLTPSRYRNLHYWAVNEYFENPALEAAYWRLNGRVAVDLSAPYDTHLQMRQALTRGYELTGTLQTMAKRLAQHLYWSLRGFEKARGYFVREDIACMWRRYKARAEMSGPGTVGLADLAGQPFVFYPLHTEPETALQTQSPEYFYQLSSIAALSRDLPAGVMLAVKEHFAGMGRRPTDFYAQISEFKNVVMLNADEFGLHCARQADATATITGTSGFEAAAMGKPVITFGRHNLYNFLPHVMVVEDENQIAGYLRRIFDGGIDAESARADGLRFLQAIADTSFDLGGYDLTMPDKVADQDALSAYQALIDSLDGGAMPEDLRAQEMAL